MFYETVYSHGNDLLFIFGESNGHNFMKKIASFDKGNKFDLNYPNIKTQNYNEIKKALSLKYLKLPDNIRTIEYCCVTKGINSKYIIIDFPTYNFNYDNHRFFIYDGETVKQYKIIDFDRYRDGGTTIIKVLDENNKENIFYYPTAYDKTKKATWNDIELFDASKVTRLKLIKLLNLEVGESEEDVK